MRLQLQIARVLGQYIYRCQLDRESDKQAKSAVGGPDCLAYMTVGFGSEDHDWTGRAGGDGAKPSR